MKWEDLLSWVLTNITDCASILISFAALAFSLKQYYCERERNRKEATIHAFDALETSESVLFLFSQSTMEITEYVQRKTEFDKRIEEEWRKLSNALHLIEHFAVGVNSKVYDLETLNSMAGNKIITTYYNCDELLLHKRIGVGNESNYSEFSNMVKALIHLRIKNNQSVPPRPSTKS